MTLPRYFRNAGYNVQGMGKIFHNDTAEDDTGESWTKYTAVKNRWKTTSKSRADTA